MITIGEIVTNMCNNKYKDGQIFQNEDVGDMTIFYDVLVWSDTLEPVEIILGDTLMWEEL